ncbi:MAG: adenylosuccinate synthetase, partial [Verrucomicrobium sp.]
GLDGLDEIKICRAYKLDGKEINHPPATIPELERCEPIYETHAGWKKDLSGLTDAADLPPLAKTYLNRLAELAGARVSLLGIGPAREQTLVVD